MKNCFTFVLLVCGVFGDPDEVKIVLEGDSVTLHTNVTDIQKDDVIKWWFGPDGSSSLLVHIDQNVPSYKDSADGTFTDRLQILNIKTGDLTIKNMRIKHSGLYKAQIIRTTGTKENLFSIVVYGVPHLTDPSAGESKIVSKTEGESVTLDTGVQTQTGDLIVWRFGDEGSLLAKDDKEDDKSPINYADKKFKGRLKLDDQTGSIIISDVLISDSGEYKLKISSNSNQILYKRFIVSVSERGLSAGQVTGIICGVLLVIAVGVIAYRRIKYEQLKQKVTVMTVPERHSVTLVTHVTNPQSDDVIQWSFRDEVIATFNKDNKISSDHKRSIERLPLDDQTRSLTIRYITTEDAGLYKVKISSSSRLKSFLQFITGGGPSYRQFNVIVSDWIKTVQLGDSVTLYTDVTGIQRGDKRVIQWRFGDEETLIAEITVGTKPSYESTDERFRDRLKMNTKTGHLTITDITSELSGVYRAKIISSRGTTYRTYRVNISVITYKGESVTLHTESEIQRDSEIKWIYEDKTILETGKNRHHHETKYTDDERFRDRLKMNHHTGDLTITHIRQRDAGLYTLQQINSDGKISCRIFRVYVRERIKPVMLGGSVTLKTDVTEIQRDDVIQWRFGDEEPLIAELTVGTEPSYDSTDERFTDRLKMNTKTGHLTITNITSELSGVYKAKIISSRGTEYRTFRVVISVFTDRGESVTLHTESEIQRDSEIKWISQDKTILVTGKNEDDNETEFKNDERFRDRLKMNPYTGDLTITDIRERDAGLYTLQQINSDGKITCRIFRVYVRENIRSVELGGSVTLKTDVTGLQTDDVIQWRFGDEETLIAKRTEGTEPSYDSNDERFRNRLELNQETGDLTITHITSELSGVYRAKIISSSRGTEYRTFRVVISTPPPSYQSSQHSDAAHGTQLNKQTSGTEGKETTTVEMPLLNEAEYRF